MKNQRKAYLYALVAIGFWSTMGSAFKLSLSTLSYSNLLLYSSWVSVIVLALIITMTGQWIKVRVTTAREWGMSFIMGLLNPFGYYLILFKAYSLIPAQEAVALNYTWPLVLVLLSIPFLKQRIPMISFLAILVSFAGAMLVVTQGDFSMFRLKNPVGSMLALCSSLLWAVFWLLNIRDQRPEQVKLFTNFLFGALLSTFYIAVTREFQAPTFKGALGFTYIGFFEMGITFFFWLKALYYSHTTARITKLVYLSPFLSLILIHFLVGESIKIFTIAGLILIIGGILGEAAVRNRDNKLKNI